MRGNGKLVLGMVLGMPWHQGWDTLYMSGFHVNILQLVSTGLRHRMGGVEPKIGGVRDHVENLGKRKTKN